jgi:hypothetical protein
MTAALVVQIIGVCVTTLSVIAALSIAVYGNRAADRRAEADRAAAREDAQHRLDLEMLVRLAENLQRGGSTDPQESTRMGSEARALLGALGPERLPLAYAEYTALAGDELRAHIDDESREEWKRCANEVVWELQRTAGAHRPSTDIKPAGSGASARRQGRRSTRPG